MNWHVDVVRRPGWSSQSTWFAEITDNTTGVTHNCTHNHSRRSLALRCALKMVDQQVATKVRLDKHMLDMIEYNH